MTRLFITSDIHGHADVLKDALEDAGFDPNDETHHLLCLGDYFDRGMQNKAVFEYLIDLHDKKKATFILGNHDLFLLEFLEGDFSMVEFNAVHNGHDVTLEAFSDMAFNPDKLETIHKKIHKNHPRLFDWLKAMPLYIEKEDYIFTHGGVDGSKDDWREQDRKGFVWNYQSRLPAVKGKTIIVGHERTAYIRLRENPGLSLEKDNDDLFDIIETDEVVYIDAFVEFSKRLNIYEVSLKSPL